MNRFPIIWFDGMHRVGKGTQIALLQSYFAGKAIEALTVRGEYNRKGKGEDPLTDPFSSRRQTNRAREDNFDEKSERLNRELRYFVDIFLPRHRKKMWVTDGVLLFDRTIFSRFMRKKILEQHDNFGALQKFRYGKAEKMVHDVLIPDLIFLFDCPTEVLLERLAATMSDYTDEIVEYKKKVIVRDNAVFQEVYQNLPEELAWKAVVIDATGSRDEIHAQILATVRKKIPWL